MASLKTKVELYLGREFTDDECFITTAHETNWETKIVKWTIAEKEQPTQEQLDALEAEATTKDNNKQAIRNRLSEYGNPYEQLQYITENGIEAWQTKVSEIKTKYPKE